MPLLSGLFSSLYKLPSMAKKKPATVPDLPVTSGWDPYAEMYGTAYDAPTFDFDQPITSRDLPYDDYWNIGQRVEPPTPPAPPPSRGWFEDWQDQQATRALRDWPDDVVRVAEETPPVKPLKVPSLKDVKTRMATYEQERDALGHEASDLDDSRQWVVPDNPATVDAFNQRVKAFNQRQTALQALGTQLDLDIKQLPKQTVATAAKAVTKPSAVAGPTLARADKERFGLSDSEADRQWLANIDKLLATPPTAVPPPPAAVAPPNVPPPVAPRPSRPVLAPGETLTGAFQRPPRTTPGRDVYLPPEGAQAPPRPAAPPPPQAAVPPKPAAPPPMQTPLAPLAGPAKTMTQLGYNVEPQFQQWYAARAQKFGLNPDPDAPTQKYDYRAAFKAGAEPDATGHWPSQFKQAGHANEVVGGFDSRTGERVPGTTQASEKELVKLGWTPEAARQLTLREAVAPDPYGRVGPTLARAQQRAKDPFADVGPNATLARAGYTGPTPQPVAPRMVGEDLANLPGAVGAWIGTQIKDAYQRFSQLDDKMGAVLQVLAGPGGPAAAAAPRDYTRTAQAMPASPGAFASFAFGMARPPLKDEAAPEAAAASPAATGIFLDVVNRLTRSASAKTAEKTAAARAAEPIVAPGALYRLASGVFFNQAVAKGVAALATPLDAANAASRGDFVRDAVASALPPERAQGVREELINAGVASANAAIALPESFVGIADIATSGMAGKVAEDYLKFRPNEARSFLFDYYSPRQKAAFANVAAQKGLIDKTIAALTNPSTLAINLVESLPLMAAGSAVGRGLTVGSMASRAAMEAGISGELAGALGEGITSMGSAAEQYRQATPGGMLTPEQVQLALVSGASTTAMGRLGNAIAGSLGVADVDTMLIAAAGNQAAKHGLVKRIIYGAPPEMLEEFLQGIPEQVLQNKATGRPWDEGIDDNVVFGTLVGGLMGAGANIRGPLRGQKAVTPPVEPQAEYARAHDDLGLVFQAGTPGELPLPYIDALQNLGLSPQQIAALTPEQASNLIASQMPRVAPTPGQAPPVAGVAPTLPSSTLDALAKVGYSPTEIAHLTPEQVQAIVAPYGGKGTPPVAAPPASGEDLAAFRAARGITAPPPAAPPPSPPSPEAPVVPSAAGETPGEPPSVPPPGGVGFVLTDAMYAGMIARGYEHAAITAMTPDQIHLILASPIPPPASPPVEPPAPVQAANAVHEALRARGYDDAAIVGLTPDQIDEILKTPLAGTPPPSPELPALPAAPAGVAPQPNAPPPMIGGVLGQMRQQLVARGYTDAAINAMTPHEAHTILSSPIPPPASRPAEPLHLAPTVNELHAQLRDLGYSDAAIVRMTPAEMRKLVGTPFDAAQVAASLPPPDQLQTHPLGTVMARVPDLIGSALDVNDAGDLVRADDGRQRGLLNVLRFNPDEQAAIRDAGVREQETDGITFFDSAQLHALTTAYAAHHAPPPSAAETTDIDELMGLLGETPEEPPAGPRWRAGATTYDRPDNDAAGTLAATIEAQTARRLRIVQLEAQLKTLEPGSPAYEATNEQLRDEQQTLKDQWTELDANMEGIDIEALKADVEAAGERAVREAAYKAKQKAEKPAPEPEPETPAVISFRSGNQQSPADIAGLIQAGNAVGVTAVMNPSVREQVVDYLVAGGTVFVDSGAYGKTEIVGGKGRSGVDFAQVLERYNQLAEAVRAKGGILRRLFVVAPDVAPVWVDPKDPNRIVAKKDGVPRSFPDETKEIQTYYSVDIVDMLRAGMQVIVPVQVGPTMAAWAVEVLQRYPGAMIGLPGNMGAISDAQFAEMLQAMKDAHVIPTGFHFLGVGAENKRQAHLVKMVQAAFPSAVVSSDATRARALFGEGRKGTAVEAQVTEERVRAIMEAPEQADFTEVLGDLYHGSLAAFEPAEIERLAQGLGSTRAELEQRVADRSLNEHYDDRHVEAEVHQILYDRAAAQLEPGSARRETMARLHPQNADARAALIERIVAKGPAWYRELTPEQQQAEALRLRKDNAEFRRFLQGLSDDELAFEATFYLKDEGAPRGTQTPAQAPEGAVAPQAQGQAQENQITGTPQPYGVAALKAAFNLTDAEAEAADILRQQLGVAEDAITVAKGGIAGDGALRQGGRVLVGALRRINQVLQQLGLRKKPPITEQTQLDRIRQSLTEALDEQAKGPGPGQLSARDVAQLDEVSALLDQSIVKLAAWLPANDPVVVRARLTRPDLFEGIRDTRGQLVAPPQSRPAARPRGPWDANAPNVLFQGEPFYSRLARAVEEAKPTRATGQQWKGMVKNAKAGISRDEYVFAHVDDLEDNKIYTKQEVLDYLSANALTVVPVVLGEREGKEGVDTFEPDHDANINLLQEQLRDQGYDVTEDPGYNGAPVLVHMNGDELTEEEEDAVPVAVRELFNRIVDIEDERARGIAAGFDMDDSKLDRTRDVRYRQFQEPGADQTSYREVFLTTPVPPANLQISEPEPFAGEGVGHYEGRQRVEGVREWTWTLGGQEGRITHWPQTFNWRGQPESGKFIVNAANMQNARFETFDAARAGILKAAEPGEPGAYIGKARSDVWVDGHPDYQGIFNPIVRVRFNVRVDGAGRRVMFLEEVQPPTKRSQAKMPPLLVTHWRELGFKWALRYAAENGLDGVAWTSGQMQADRYALEKQVSAIHWSKLVPGEPVTNAIGEPVTTALRTVFVHPTDGATIQLHVNARGVVVGGNHRSGNFTGNPLSEVLGKEIARRITDEPKGTLEGEGLKIGGTGLKQLYDVDFPRVVNSIPAVKKAGVRATSLDISMPSKGEMRWRRISPIEAARFIDSNGANAVHVRYRGDYRTIADVLVNELNWQPDDVTELERDPAGMLDTLAGELPMQEGQDLELFARTGLTEPTSKAVPGVLMTPELRDAVMGGQPMFQGAQGATEFMLDGKAIIRGFESANVSTAVHELFHVARRQRLNRAVPVELRGGITDADLDVFEKWAGVGEDGDWTVDAEEKAARGFERYLRDGGATFKGQLAKVFEAIKQWMTDLYQQVQGSEIDIHITPEVRAVFDKLVGAERVAAIEAAGVSTGDLVTLLSAPAEGEATTAPTPTTAPTTQPPVSRPTAPRPAPAPVPEPTPAPPVAAPAEPAAPVAVPQTKTAQELAAIAVRREEAKRKLAEHAANIRALLNRPAKMGLVPDPEIAKAIIGLAKEYIKLGILEFQEAAVLFREQFGEDATAEDYFERAWALLQEINKGTPPKQAMAVVNAQTNRPTVAAAVQAYTEAGGAIGPDTGGGDTGGAAEPGGGLAGTVRAGGEGALGTLPAEPGGAAAGAGTPGAGPGGAEGGASANLPGGPDAGTESPAAPGPGGGTVSPGSVPTAGGTAGPVGIKGDKPPDYQLTPERIAAIISRTNIPRLTDNVAALRLVRELLAENRYATPAEQDVLAKYVGWGGSEIQQYLEDRPRYDWSANERALWQELRDMTTPEQRTELIRSAPNAHYTYDLYTPIWKALTFFGFTGGRVLEPSVGTGHALGFMPAPTRANSTISASELDPTTAAMASYLYPSATIQPVGYENIRLPRNTQDLAISNVPFGDFVVFDKNFTGVRKFLTEKIHSYFFAKALEHVRPGGYIVFITSQSTMDGPEHLNIRRYLMSKGHFVGAVRLPGGKQGAFVKGAKTQVVTDLVVLQKFKTGEDAAAASSEYLARQGNDKLFIEAPPHPRFSTPARTVTDANGKERTIPPHNVYRSAWYTEHPQFILGTEAMTGTRYEANEYNVEARPGENLQDALETALQTILPKGAYEPASTTSTEPEAKLAEGAFKPGELRVGDKPNTIHRVQLNGELIDATPRTPSGSIDLKKVARTVGQIGIRDLRRDVIAAMKSPTATKVDIEKVQGRLLKAYEAFTKEYGILNHPVNKSVFKSDPEAAMLLGLENMKITAKVVIDKNGKKTLPIKMIVESLADIFTKRTIHVTPEITRVSTPGDAMLASLGTKAKLDWAYMARITGDGSVTPARIRALQRALINDGRIFEQPDGALISRDEYLSGDVVSKLADVVAAAEQLPPGPTPEAIAKAEAAVTDAEQAFAEARRAARDVVVREGGRALLYPERATGRRPTEGLQLSRARGRVAQARRALTALRDAEAAGKYDRNIAALLRVQPVPKTKDDIDSGQLSIALGVHWVAPEDVARFVTQQTGRDGTEMRLDGAEQYIRWTGVYPDEVQRASNAHPLTVRYGNPERPPRYFGFIQLLEHALNLKQPNLGYSVKIGGKSVRIDQPEQTLAARANIEEVRKLWTEFVYQDEDVLKRVLDTFNTRFNRNVKREYDGSHLANYINGKGEPASPAAVDDQGQPVAPEDRGVRSSALPGLSLDFSLYPHQLRAIWRILTTGNTLLAHEVGAGKTFEMIAAAMEMRRTGRARKPMITVPTNLLAQWRKDIVKAYPTAKLLAFDDKDLLAAKRQEAMARIAHGDWDIVLVPHSSFELLKVSDKRIEATLNEWVAEIVAAEAEARAERGDDDESVKQLEAARRRIEARIAAMIEKAQEGTDEGLTWDDLGVDALLVDEAHVYKNLYYFSKINNLRGLGKPTAEKSLDMFIKVKDINEASNYRNLVFATATPVMNSLAEVYTMQRYLQPQRLRELGFQNFDNWYASFAEAKTVTEKQPDGSYKEVQRVAKFRNGRMLHRIVSDVMDYVGWDDMPYLKLPKLKGGEYTIVQGQPHPMYATLENWFRQRIAAIKATPPHVDRATGEYIAPDRFHPITGKRMFNAKGEPAKDNILTIMNDAKLGAIDARLVLGEHAEDVPGSRVQTVVKAVADYHKRETPMKGVALIFLDVGTPKTVEPLEFLAGVQLEDDTEGEALGTEEAPVDPDEDEDANALASSEFDGVFNMYEAIKKGLIARGVPSHEIAFIHQARNAAERLALFQAAQDGTIRVLLASTDKGGLGMNIQDRLGLIVEADAPRAMRPGDVRQRLGRGMRSGNKYAVLEVMRFITQGTTDEWLYGLLGDKQGMITQFMKGELDNYEDEDPANRSFEEAEARATRNPLALELVKLKGSMPRLEAQAAAADRALADARAHSARDRAALPGLKAALEILSSWVRDAYEKVTADNFAIHVGFGPIGTRILTERPDANKALIAAMQPLAEQALKLRQYSSVGQEPWTRIGEIQGVPIQARATFDYYHGTQNVTVALDADAAGEGDIEVTLLLVGKDGRPTGTFGEGRNIIASIVDKYNHLPAEVGAQQAKIATMEERLTRADAILANPPAAPQKLIEARKRVAEIERILKTESDARAEEAARAHREAVARRAQGGDDTPDDDVSDEGLYDVSHGGVGSTPRAGDTIEVPTPDGGTRTIPVVPIEFPELVDLAREIQKVPTVRAKFYKLGVRGQFAYEEGVQILGELFRKGNEAQLAATLAHEIGHLIDWLPDYTLKRGNLLGHLRSLRNFLKGQYDNPDGVTIKNAVVKAELTALSNAWRPWDPATAPASFKKYRAQAIELYADAVSVMLNNPGLALEVAPTFYKEFMAELDAKPAVKSALFDIWTMLSGTTEELLQRRENGIDGMFAEANTKANDLLQRERNDRKLDWKNIGAHTWELYRRLIDKHEPFIRRLKGDQAKGLNIAPRDNPFYALSERAYRLAGWTKSWLETNVQPLRERLQAHDLTWVDFGKALMWTRIIEGDRGEIANPRGFNEQYAQTQYEFMLKKLTPKQRTVLTEEMEAFREAVKEVARLAHAAGLYADATMKDIEANQAYATYRTIEHMDEHMSSAIYQQIGTLKDIQNVADATVLKTIVTMRAIEHQRVKLLAFRYLHLYHPADIADAKMVRNEKGATVAAYPSREPKLPATVLYKRQGRLVGKYVDEHVANSLNNRMAGENWQAIAALNGVFKRLFTTYSTGFQLFNIRRDFKRFWKNIPEMTRRKAIQRYWEARHLAVIRTYGLASPEASRWRQFYRSMMGRPMTSPTPTEEQAWKDMIVAQRQGILGPEFRNRDAYRLEDEHILNIMAAAGVGGEEEHHTLLKPLMYIADAIGNTGNFIEALPKAAGIYEYQGDGRIEDIPADERHFIRTSVGSPDYLAGGTWKPVTNNLLLFSNAITQAWRSDLKIAFAPTTMSGYWWKTAQSNILPKMFTMAALLAAAAAGAGGGDDEDDETPAGMKWVGRHLAQLPVMGPALVWAGNILRKVPEYDLTNYVIIPLKLDAQGNAVVLRIPQEDTGRFWGGLTWKMLAAARGDRDLWQAFANTIDYTGGQFPSPSPWMGAIGHGVEYAGGRNPVDTFRQREVLTKDEQLLRHTQWQPFRKFMGWELQQLGAGAVYKFYLGDDRPIQKTPAQKFLDWSGVSDTLGRFVKVTKAGEREAARRAGEPAEWAGAERRQSEQDAVNAQLRAFQALPKAQQTVISQRQVGQALAKQLYPEEKDPRAQAANARRLTTRFKASLVHGQDDTLMDVLAGKTNAEKVTIIYKSRRNYTPTQFTQWLQLAVDEGAISKQVRSDVLKKMGAASPGVTITIH